MDAAHSTFLVITGSNYSLNTSKLEGEKVRIFALSLSGLICAPMLLAFLILVCCVHKRYKTTFQRLILYHVIVSLFCEITFAVEIVLNFDSQVWICAILSYLFSYFVLMFYIYTTAVTNVSLVFAIRLTKGSFNTWKGAEFVCVAMAVVLPLVYIGIQVRHGTYLVLVCDNHDLSSWNGDSIVFNGLILIMCSEILVVYFTLCILFCLLRRKLRNTQLTSLLKRLMYLAGINTAIMGLATLSAMYCLFRYKDYPSTVFSITIYVVLGIGEPFICLVSCVFHSSLSICRQNHFGCMCTGCCTVKQGVVPLGNRNETATNPTSHPVNQASHTYFSVPYTGAFTQVMSGEQTQTKGEETPLIQGVLQ